MNLRKERIINDFAEGNVSNIEMQNKINNYLEEYPYDVDIRMLGAYLNMLEDETDSALEILLSCKEHSPFDADILFLIAICYENKKELFLAAEFYNRALNTFVIIEENFIFCTKDKCLSSIKRIEENIKAKSDRIPCDEMRTFSSQLSAYLYQTDNMFWQVKDIIRKREKRIGQKHWYSDNNLRYCGFYNARDALLNSHMLDLVSAKGEFLKIDYEGLEYFRVFDSEYLLPIATDESCLLSIKIDDKQPIYINQNSGIHFNYYRVKGKIQILSDCTMYVGEPIQLIHSSKRKKLVLSLFIDGLSQQVINEVGFETLMPNTYEFFKKGLVFKNAFTTSDWTFPSVASYMSGMNVPNHMMVHPNLSAGIPNKANIYLDNIKEAGYHTTVFSGNWRISCSDGYFNSVDRLVCQHTNIGFNSGRGVFDLIEHLDTFSETDQYVFYATGELHDVADGFDMPASVQAHLPIEECEFESIGETSVKQTYSLKKRAKYIECAKSADKHLKCLYDYILSHYDEDEFVVSLFSDHGQGFLIPPDAHHSSRPFSNVAFMIRGNRLEGICDEYISAIDYPQIITSLANTEYKSNCSEGVIPKALGGTDEHDVVITETIHPGDAYMAALRNKKYTFYITTKNVVSATCRLEWGDYDCWLEDSNGQRFEDAVLKEKNIAWIKNHIKYLINY